jgi:putative membrane protein
LVLYLGSLPFVLVAKMGYAAPLVVAVVALGMLGIEDAGVEIENPFGLTPNALPLESICTTIARDCTELVRSED